MAIETHVHDGSAYRKAKQIFVHDGSAWRDIKEAWCHDGTAWRKVFKKGYWQSVLSAALPASSSTITDVFVYNDEVYISRVSGTFGSWGIQVYKWSGSAWSAVGSPIPTVNSNAGCFYLVPFKSSNGLYVFIMESGKSYYFDGSSWVLDVQTYVGSLSYTSLVIASIVTDGSRMFYPTGSSYTGVAVWDGSTVSYYNGLDYVESIAYHAGSLYAFAEVGGADNIFRWTGSAWVSIGVPSFSNLRLFSDGTTLYAFTDFDSNPYRYTGSAWIACNAIANPTVNARRWASFNGHLIADAEEPSTFDVYPAVFDVNTKLADLDAAEPYFAFYFVSNGSLYGANFSTSTIVVKKWTGDLPA